MNPHLTAYIDLSALQHNIRVVRQLAGKNCKILAMVKANAYGHGLLSLLPALKNVDALGVACLAEALQLRAKGVQQRIVVMQGFLYPEEIPVFAEQKIESVIHCQQQLHLLKSAKLATPLIIWLKVDTGMHRLGFLPKEFSGAYTELQQCSSVQKPFVIMTHLADADNSQDFFTKQQCALFQELLQDIAAPVSLGNSAAIFAYTPYLRDWVRPGIMLYGVSPFADKTAQALGLQPVMTLTATVLAVKSLRAGDKVGYGCTWTTEKNTKIAILSAGYADGYPRHAPNGVAVSINNKICQLAGRVSMDTIAVDIGNNDVQVGDSAVLWGAGLPIEDLAKAAKTIAYELLCHVSSRIQFIYR